MNKGYAIVLLDVEDRELYVEYGRKSTEIEERYGGKSLIASDANEVVDGTWPAQRVVVLEFPDIEKARGWYSDPDYRQLIPLRHEATESAVLLVEGFLPG
ncbi:MAG: DUF1330 domain-containing protein [Acidimicrobiia bacterium]|nr:DUF1330 domain-containing protein [Acidimicrobiia bacterium]